MLLKKCFGCCRFSPAPTRKSKAEDKPRGRNKIVRRTTWGLQVVARRLPAEEITELKAKKHSTRKPVVGARPKVDDEFRRGLIEAIEDAESCTCCEKGFEATPGPQTMNVIEGDVRGVKLHRHGLPGQYRWVARQKPHDVRGIGYAQFHRVLFSKPVANPHECTARLAENASPSARNDLQWSTWRADKNGSGEPGVACIK